MSQTEPTDSHIISQLTDAWAFMQKGDAASAFQKFKELTEKNPESSDSWEGLGACFQHADKIDSAILAFQRALKYNPQSAYSLTHLGHILVGRKDFMGAIPVLLEATTLNPSSGTLWFDLGRAELGAEQFVRAEQSFKTAIAMKPRLTIAWLNLAACQRELARQDEALDSLEEALKIEPHNIDAAIRQASIYSDLGQTDKGIAVLDRLLQKHPQSAELHQHKALVLLRAQRFGEGFEEYEWRLYPSPQSISARPFDIKRWNGEPLTEKKLLIWLEQGIGDELLSLGVWRNFLSGSDGSHCIIECDERLTSLIQRSFPKTTVVARTDPPSLQKTDAGFVCPSWSGARILEKQNKLVGTQAPFLVADKSTVNALQQKLRNLANGRMIVGLSWASGSANRRLKTPPLRAWVPLLQDASLFFVSLQFAPHSDDLKVLTDLTPSDIYVDEGINAATDMDSLAAQIMAVDKVITISNTTAHMAGALGADTALLVPKGYGCYWYWHQDRTDSPWYSSMHICRQETPGDWGAAMVKALEWSNRTP
jgi:tetratricopeptide (TPR) repeat protein